jgi:hypothetical protein
MKYSVRILGVSGALLLAGCAERGPTSPTIEQRVFQALGGLAVGESLTLRGRAAAEVLVGGAGPAGDFVVIPFHATTAGSAQLRVALRGEGLAPPPEVPQSGVAPGWSPVANVTAWEAHERHHARMTADVREHIRFLRRTGALAQLRVPPPRRQQLGANTTVGQIVQLNANALGNACTAVDMRPARVEAVSNHAIVVADTTNPSGGFTRLDFEAIAAEFDRLIYPTVTRHFGTPPDIDANQRVVIFYTRAVNEMTRPTDQGYVGGFFWARDLIPRSASCAASNEAEIFFMLVPDPSALASHIPHSRDALRQSTLATVGHEFQHLINAGRRLDRCGFDCFEELWLDEGLSHIAEEVLFYAETNRRPRSNISRATLAAGESESLNRYMGSNLVRYGLYLERVTAHSVFGAENFGSLEMRGASWAFLRYLADHSGRADEEFFRSLVQTERTGVENLRGTIDEEPLEALRRWGVSVFTDDLVATAVEFQQPSWHFRSWLPPVFGNRFPLQTHTLGPGGAVDLEIRGGTSGYVYVRGGPGAGARVTTSVGGASPPDELRVTVVRTR